MAETPSAEELEVLLTGELSSAVTRYGLGVIAVNDGSRYVEAGSITDHIPEPPRYDVPVVTELYRRFSPNSPAAIDIRLKAAASLALFERTHLNIVLGSE